jgi:hypothetical protein
MITVYRLDQLDQYTQSLVQKLAPDMSKNINFHINGWELTVEMYNVIFLFISNLQLR